MISHRIYRLKVMQRGSAKVSSSSAQHSGTKRKSATVSGLRTNMLCDCKCDSLQSGLNLHWPQLFSRSLPHTADLHKRGDKHSSQHSVRRRSQDGHRAACYRPPSTRAAGLSRIGGVLRAVRVDYRKRNMRLTQRRVTKHVPREEGKGGVNITVRIYPVLSSIGRLVRAFVRSCGGRSRPG